MRKKSLIEVFLLTIFTCGFYYIYWEAITANETSRAAGEEEISVALSILFVFSTCGLWSIYLNYKIAKNIYTLELTKNNYAEDLSGVAIILSVFGWAIVAQLILQDRINRYCEEKGMY